MQGSPVRVQDRDRDRSQTRSRPPPTPAKPPRNDSLRQPFGERLSWRRAKPCQLALETRNGGKPAAYAIRPLVGLLIAVAGLRPIDLRWQRSVPSVIIDRAIARHHRMMIVIIER